MTVQDIREKHSGKLTIGLTSGLTIGLTSGLAIAVATGFYRLGQMDNRVSALEVNRIEAREERRELHADFAKSFDALRIEMREGFNMLLNERTKP